MTDQEIRQGLEAFRSGRLPAEDPLVAEALQRAKDDPELARWWRQRQGSVADDVFTPLPGEPVLRNDDDEDEAPDSPPRSRPVPRRKAVSLLALLASLGLVALVARQWRRPEPPADFADYRDALLGLTRDKPPELEVLETDLVRLQEALAQRNAPVPARLTEGLRRCQATGCGTIEWRRRPVGLVAFLGAGQEAWLFVTRRAGLVGAPAGSHPVPTQGDGWATASWSDKDRVYLLATRGTVEGLVPFL